MEHYRLGDTVVLGEESVNRFDVTRPDGTIESRDWDRRVPRVTVRHVGSWSWRLYRREGTETLLESGQFSVGEAEGTTPRRRWFGRRRG